MRRLQVRVLSGVLGRVVELVDTKHLNCFSPNGECGFDSRPDYEKLLNMELYHNLERFFWSKVLPVIFKTIQYALLIALLYAFVLMGINVFNELT